MSEFVLGTFFGAGLCTVLYIITYFITNLSKGFSSRVYDFAAPKYPKAEPVEQDSLGIEEMMSNTPTGKVGEKIDWQVPQEKE